MNAAQLGARAEMMLTALGAISDERERLTRLFLTPAHARAIALTREWMTAAGLAVRVDPLATVHGLWASAASGPTARKRLLLGSHIDTVVDAGRYDGALGVVAAIIAVEEMRGRGIALPFAVEVLAFGDEEGVRFPMTLTSSMALAGAFDAAALDGSDRNGVTLRAALTAFGGDPDRIAAQAYRRDEVIGYVEVHIEQGPVLEAANEPLAVVSSIAGQSRHRVKAKGISGHAGTVPMALRHDALAAAAEMILAVESTARNAGDPLVATVGEITALPGVVNVVPGEVAFSLDVRTGKDDARRQAIKALQRSFAEIADRRNVGVTMTTVHETPVTPASPRLRQIITDAITAVAGPTPREMMSGAGHDGQAMARLTEIGMIFVRCRAGVSHNPEEYASPADMGLAIEALIGTITRIAAAVS